MHDQEIWVWITMPGRGLWRKGVSHIRGPSTGSGNGPLRQAQGAVHPEAATRPFDSLNGREGQGSVRARAVRFSVVSVRR